MAVIATGSKHSRNTCYIIAAACIIFAGWFAYDGWISETYQQENTVDGKPNTNLLTNRYIPIPLVLVAAYFLFASMQVARRKITADEEKLVLDNGVVIPYTAINKIDKRYFEKEGHFTIEYSAEGAQRTVKLRDARYDGLGLLLDEVVRRTGAQPESNAKESEA
ncbi:MAG: hypothetical protein JW709_03835 [Sedimentisphaerales bacterium]|nr:hypothetical protein [Sedimentisphaerales bacterium]